MCSSDLVRRSGGDLRHGAGGWVACVDAAVGVIDGNLAGLQVARGWHATGHGAFFRNDWRGHYGMLARSGLLVGAAVEGDAVDRAAGDCDIVGVLRGYSAEAEVCPGGGDIGEVGEVSRFRELAGDAGCYGGREVRVGAEEIGRAHV